MIHANHVFQIAEEVTDIAALAESLTQYTWTLCTAFKLVVSPGAEPLFFLNDSFSENGAQEYAVVRNGRMLHCRYKCSKRRSKETSWHIRNCENNCNACPHMIGAIQAFGDCIIAAMRTTFS